MAASPASPRQPLWAALVSTWTSSRRAPSWADAPRLTRFPAPNEDAAETIDNCQHLLLRCCVNLLDFYQRLGVRDRIRFYREVYFLEPGGRLSVLRRGRLPAPFHFAGSFLRMRCLNRADKFGIARALLAIRREHTRRTDLDRISMLDWLLQKRQTPRAIDRFWRQVLVSAVNEDLDRMAAVHGFQVFWLGFLARADSYEMGIPTVPLAQLYAADAWQRLANVRFHLRSPVERIDGSGFTGGRRAPRRRSLHLRAAFRASRSRRAAGPRVRPLAHHRRAPVVRPRGHHAAACHSARPHHAVDVQ